MRVLTKTYNITEIRAANAAAGQFFFEPATLRFFRSRILPKVYQGPGGIYFVTSEQFVPSSGVPAARKYTVRKFNPADADIDTVGTFNDLTQREAMRVAALLAAGKAVD